MSNRFVLAQLLFNKLTELTGVTIRSITELSSINVETEAQPALYVSWYGDTIEETRRAGQITLATDTWLFILAITDTRPENTLATAGIILANLSSLLNGWLPPSVSSDSVRAVGPLKVCSSPPPHYRDGYSFYTTVFTVQMTIN